MSLSVQSVWGSYWEDGRWGYACCYSLIRGSYCTGESGKIARKVTDSLDVSLRNVALYHLIAMLGFDIHLST